MSIYMHLFCPETKLTLWLGDWRDWNNPFGHQLHSVQRDGDTRTLERFLAMHRGKELRYLHDVVKVACRKTRSTSPKNTGTGG